MTSEHKWGAARFTVTTTCGAIETITVSGRDRWALECVIAAGQKGCTPIDTPGPRWSSYVHNLRKLGLKIETITEPHDGPFKGTHARYVLRSTVWPTCNGEAAQ